MDSLHEADGSPCVVLIEDDEHTREACAALLISSGYRVFAEPDGMAGIAAVHRHRPDLVITDIGLPHLGGREVARALHADSRTCHIPVIVTTAETTCPGPGDAGLFTAVVHKPFDLDTLLSAIRRASPRGRAVG